MGQVDFWSKLQAAVSTAPFRVWTSGTAMRRRSGWCNAAFRRQRMGVADRLILDDGLRGRLAACLIGDAHSRVIRPQ